MQFVIRSQFLLPLILLIGLPLSAETAAHPNYVDWNPELYHKYSNVQEERTCPFFARFQLREDDQILDLGSGDGKITAKLARKVPKGLVVGLDVSKKMVDFAQQSFDSTEYPNLSFELGDASKFFIAKKFDFIVSFNALHWVPDVTGIVSSVHKHLKPNGKIYFVFPIKYDRTPFEMAISFVSRLPKWKKYFAGFSSGIISHNTDTFIESLISYGFKIETVTFKSGDSTFASSEDFRKWLKSGMPHLNQVPAELKDDFLGDFESTFLQLDTCDSAGQIHWPHYIAEIIATAENVDNAIIR